ncbi:MAG: DUF4974 domain-containing protein [Tenacibaculum sp.]
MNNASLEELSIVFESVFDKKIVFSNNYLKNIRLSITFNQRENIEKIIERINYINEVQLIIKNTYKIEAISK